MDAPRTLIVGDVHGCADELDALLRAAGYARGDRLVFVGDLVAKGPDSRGVIERARELGALGVRGNHEMPVIAWGLADRAGEPLPKIKDTHRSVAESLSEADLRYLEALPYYLDLPELDTTVVHAGLVPGVPLAEQDPEAMITMRSLRDDGRPSKKLGEGTLWASAWRGPRRVVFGHDAVTGMQRHPLAIGLDTGCVYGGKLSALDLPSGELVQVSARKAWSPF